eukprot:1143114-Pelagomonas_calceolata.AAC.1
MTRPAKQVLSCQLQQDVFESGRRGVRANYMIMAKHARGSPGSTKQAYCEIERALSGTVALSEHQLFTCIDISIRHECKPHKRENFLCHILAVRKGKLCGMHAPCFNVPMHIGKTPWHACTLLQRPHAYKKDSVACMHPAAIVPVPEERLRGMYAPGLFFFVLAQPRFQYYEGNPPL